MKVLDLFCGAGGASMGYHRAGFDVVGIDINPQPRYPFEFHETDALTYPLDGFDLIHASPPCQAYSDLEKRNKKQQGSYPELIEPIRERLIGSGIPYVIENVETAPLLGNVVLCGTMFSELRVLRHRRFECSFPVAVPRHQRHPLVFTLDKRKSQYGKLDQDDPNVYVMVNGGGNCSVAKARLAMGIDWMTKDEINEAIPPAYTEHVGSAALLTMSQEAA